MVDAGTGDCVVCLETKPLRNIGCGRGCGPSNNGYRTHHGRFRFAVCNQLPETVLDWYEQVTIEQCPSNIVQAVIWSFDTNNFDLRAWWRMHLGMHASKPGQREFGLLAAPYLSSCSNAIVEGIFSVAGNCDLDHASRMKSETLEQRVLVSTNERWWGKDEVSWDLSSPSMSRNKKKRKRLGSGSGKASGTGAATITVD